MTESVCTTLSCGDRKWNNADGELHREGAPAVIYTDGDKEWWQNDRLHRTDGPAIEYFEGRKYWYLKGLHLTEAQHRVALPEPDAAPCEGKVVIYDGQQYRLTAV